MTLIATALPIPDIFFPFIAAALYCVSVIFVKFASRNRELSGISVLVMTNLLSGLVFIPQIFFESQLPPMSIIWQPLIASAFCAVGNIATFICAEKGEISLMTPIMGIKILIVIMLARLFLDIDLPHAITISGAICCVAIFIMGYSRDSLNSKKLLLTFFLAITACASYAACDILMQKYAHNFTRGAMLSLTTIMIPLSIIPLIPRFAREVRLASYTTISIGFASATFMVVEMYMMFLSITGEVGAPLCNILYNTRGLMAITFVYFLGKRFASLRELSNASATQRAVGATMILIAVAIVLT